MQIHELNTFAGTPGDSNFLAIDNGSDTGKISGTNLLKPVNDRVDNLVASVTPDSAVVLLDMPNGINAGANTLSQSVADFDYLEFYIGAAGDMKTIGGYIRVPVDQGGVEINIPSKSSAFLYDQQIKLTWSGTTLNQTAYNLWEWDGVASNGATSQSSTWVTQVIRVVGIKTSSNTPAELADIRVGYDGITYPSAGDAVRGNDRYNDYHAGAGSVFYPNLFGYSNLIPSISWDSGKYLNTSGQETVNANGMVSDYIQVDGLYHLAFCSVENYTGYSHRICAYDANKTFLGYYTFYQSTAINGVNFGSWSLPLYTKYIRVATVIAKYGKIVLLAPYKSPTTTQITTKFPELMGLINKKVNDYTVTIGSLDPQGEPASPSATHRAYTPKINKEYIYSILEPTDSNLQITIYAYDQNDNPLGYYYLGGFSQSNISWIRPDYGTLILGLLNDYPNIKNIRIYLGTINSSPLTETQIKSFVVMGRFSSTDNWFSPKKWYAIGDSITYGTYSKSDGTIARNPLISYPKVCSDLIGYDLVNYGVPNLGFTVNATDPQFTDDTIVKVLQNHDYAGAELVTIALGTNDYGRDGVLGTIADNSSVNSVYGRFKLIVETLMTKCPTARIIFFTPIPRETRGSANSQYDKTVPNNSGFTFNAVKNAILESCEYYGIECFNLTDNFVLNYANHTTYQKDNLHPTVEGHALMAKCLANRLIF